MSNDIPTFRVWSNSRHPVLGRDYDSKTHRYTKAYLNPGKYTILVDAFPGTEFTGQVIDSGPGGLLHPIRLYRLKVPAGTTGFAFSIKGIDNQFSKSQFNPSDMMTTKSFSTGHPTTGVWGWSVDVPEEGTYEITVQYRNKAGKGPISPPHRITLRDFLIVSIGDSAASGQGSPDKPGKPEGFEPEFHWYDAVFPPLALYEVAKAAAEWGYNKLKQEFTTLAAATEAKIDMDPEPIWLEKNAHRSLLSGPALAAKLLEDTGKGRMITFLSFARTDSEIQGGLLGPRTADGKPNDPWIGNIGQIDEIKQVLGNRRIDALLISIGVNDVGVTGNLKDMMKNDNIILHPSGGGDDDKAREEVKRRALDRLADLPAKFKALDKALKALNIRHIYLTEYPTGLFDRKNGEVGEGCGIFSSDFDVGLDKKDTQVLKELVERLNTKLESATKANKRGWFYISGIADGFKGHGYCTDDHFFYWAEESLVIQGDTLGAVHPNAKGQHVYAQQIAAMVKQNTLEKRDMSTLEKWLEPVLSVMMS